MSDALDELGEAYGVALERYVAAPSESTLEAAYEIGRQAMTRRFAMLDLVAAHQRVLARLLAHLPSPRGAAEVGDRAMQFLLEALSPFEMTLRGFRDAVASLEREVAERTRAQEALKVAHDHLEERVERRTAELSTANDRLRLEAAERARAETALLETERSYQLLVANVRDHAILMLDPGGLVASWNPGAQRIKGYLPDEIIGAHFSVFYTPEDRQAGHPQQVLARAAEEGSCEEEGWRVRKDGSRFWADTVITSLRAADGTLKGFTKVTRDVTERRRAQQALEELNAQLQRSNDEKDQFVALISHELRNPLAAVMSGADVLMRTLPTDHRSRRALEIIRRNAALEKRLVNDLLDLSRLTRDRLPLQRAPVALDTVAQSCVNDEEGAAAAAGLALTLNAESGAWVLGDPDRLQQVLLNLLGNAMKFTPAGGRIDVRLYRSTDDLTSLASGRVPRVGASEDAPAARSLSVCLVVEDTGTGIDSASLAKLFEPFRQGDIASHRERGLGLGLALVKLITEKHGGKVWADSKGVNQGSRFVVALPALHVEPAAVPLQEDRATRLLLVEANPETRALLAANLESIGYRVTAVASCEEALQAVSEMRPDVILCDSQAASADRCAFLEQARQTEGGARLPAFAVLASGLEDDWQRLRAAGFAGHFVKPVDVRAVDRAIRAWFAMSGKGA